jgi:methionine synthase II (cobalamin-independent)
LSRRVPAATLWLQVDEPSLVAVRAGAIPTASGFSTHRSVDTPEVVDALAPLAAGFAPDGESVLHCCAPGDWLDVARSAGFASVSVDAAIVDRNELAEWCDEQRGVILGVVDSAARAPQGVDALVRRALATWRPLQMALYDGVLLGTSCGLAGWSRADVSPQLSALGRAAALFEESTDR